MFAGLASSSHMFGFGSSSTDMTLHSFFIIYALGFQNKSMFWSIGITVVMTQGEASLVHADPTVLSLSFSHDLPCILMSRWFPPLNEVCADYIWYFLPYTMKFVEGRR